MGLFNKKELARIAELERENEILKATLSKTKGLSVAQEEKYLQRLKEQNQEERKAIMELKDEITALESKKASIQNDLDEINLEVDFAEVGLYKPPYSSYSSEKYKAKLEANRSHQKNMVKNGTAVTGNMEWTVNGNLKAVDYREANKKAGYVYVISNIGSFGENVYKIGMTRRLEPQDRVDELGDASVPFQFDVHAMIFSDDAPALEAKLHQRFNDFKVNMINNRKEFFKVPLKDIMQAVKEYHAQAVEFTELPDAVQYRESVALRDRP